MGLHGAQVLEKLPVQGRTASAEDASHDEDLKNNVRYEVTRSAQSD